MGVAFRVQRTLGVKAEADSRGSREGSCHVYWEFRVYSKMESCNQKTGDRMFFRRHSHTAMRVVSHRGACSEQKQPSSTDAVRTKVARAF